MLMSTSRQNISRAASLEKRKGRGGGGARKGEGGGAWN